MLQWIRRARTKKKFRTIAIIGIAVLSFGLIGSYAWWSVPKSSSRGGSEEAIDPSVEYKQMEEYISELEKSLAEKPDDPELLEKVGNAYYDLGYRMLVEGADAAQGQNKLNEALKKYEEVLEITPNNIPLILQAAYTASIVGNVEKGEALYQKALSLDAKSIEAKSYYGQFLLYSKNDYEGARKQWQEALALNPDEGTKKSLESLIENSKQLEEFQKKQEESQKQGKNED